MHKTTVAFSALLMFSIGGTAVAAGTMKPGLWEMTMKSDAMAAMPKISPEQMEMMRQAGVKLPQMDSGGIVTKVCITREMAARDQPPNTAQGESGCETKNYRRKGSSYSMDMVCNGAHMKGKGTIKGTYRNDRSFSSTMDFTGTAQGRPVNQHTESSGKWIGADCGSVKPAGAYAGK